MYDKAENEIASNSTYKDKYRPVYDAMRDTGIESYSVDDMDVTIIVEIILAKFDDIRIDNKTKNALLKVRQDRNDVSHLNGNEDEADLYLYGLMALTDLKSFVRSVDKFEKEIDDEARFAYRRGYVEKIDALQRVLDKERFALLSWEIQLDNNLQTVKKSRLPSHSWGKLRDYYFELYFFVEHDFYKYFRFIIRSEEEGLIESGVYGVDTFVIEAYLQIRDYQGAARKMRLLPTERWNDSNVQRFLEVINHPLVPGNENTEGKEEVIRILSEKGFRIHKDEENGYILTTEGE